MYHAATLQFVATLRTPLLTDAMVSVTALGSVAVGAIIIYTLYHFDHRETATLTLVAAVVATTAAKAFKLVIGRARPEVVSVVIRGYPQTAAFPSGHTTLAFALATVLEQELDGANYYFLLLAAFVGVSRLYLGLHWPGDVIAGAVLGMGVGYAVHRFRDQLLGIVSAALPSSERGDPVFGRRQK